ncbi:TetR/AcrR family transcriptional regulator [Agitococcus lubricus]|uniref:TetR family transcriptional regulator n=1 Tax=Agitococcus lubricus TaxID=1077255 RepID=A0A2T5J1T2_9GAMM|nr:TetR/AcrR family transcriptional regulator [Agitococcus lubricus]PTQ90387.1 TetR family transcriptional regulator [Agitococcus lubricus]
MRYSAKHKAETRQTLIEKAGALAKQDGFATTGVDSLMATVGLTGGAFYNHFSSKDELLLEIIRQELKKSQHLLETNLANASTESFLDLYLSQLHLNFPALGCALPSLTTEVSRADEAIKQTFADGLAQIHHTLNTHLANPQLAWATLAMTVGAVNLARAMPTGEQQQILLESCKNILLMMSEGGLGAVNS